MLTTITTTLQRPSGRANHYTAAPLCGIGNTLVTLALRGEYEGLGLFVCPCVQLKNYCLDLLDFYTQEVLYPWLGPPLR